jgi:hypothetical protein
VLESTIDFLACHRLDKGTTGVCIFAKTRNAAAHFATMLKSHRLRKYYITRVHGEFKSDTKIVVIDKPVLGNDRRHTVEAKTFVSLLFFESETNTSLLVCAPVTGRYHQIRQHLWDYGYPIVHDHEIKKTQSVTEARNYPWEWDTKELARCNNNVQQYIDERFERQQKEFFESRQFEMIQLHAFRYEHVEDETILWRYETKNLPSWAHDVDREQLNDIVCEIAKLSNIQQVEEVDDVTREVSALDKYYCMSKECTKHAKEIKTAELLYQKWNRPLRSEECTYHCTKHGQQVTSNCIICNQDILWKKCNYCQKCKNDLDALTT